MAVLVLAPLLEAKIKAERGDAARWDEVWEGVYVVAPMPDIEHQGIISELCFTIRETLGRGGGARVYAGCNVSDRGEGWMEDFRIPEVAVYLPGNLAEDCDTHYRGGPDLAVEVVTPLDRSREKGPFYAKVGVREFLVIDRRPWAIELYRPGSGVMRLVGRSTIREPEMIRLDVLPLSFRLVGDELRPSIEVIHQSDGRRWTIDD